MTSRCLTIALLAAPAILASGPSGTSGSGGGGGTGGGGTTATSTTTAEVRSLNERIPAGGTVHAKFLLTQPRPITGGGASLTLSSKTLKGVSVTSPLGDTAGAAVAQNGSVYVSIISPSSDFGTNLDYPFLTVTMDIPASTAAGSVFPLTLGAGNFQSPDGAFTLTNAKPGALTIGGSISMSGVFPGGGTWPAGTVIRVMGTGFQPGTKISTKMKTSNAVYVSPGEMRFSLQEATTMDAQPIQAGNPDGSMVVFYAYLRGKPVSTPSRLLLQNTDPIFQTQTHGFAIVGPLPSEASGQFTALAIENPTTGPVVVNFELRSTGAMSSVLLPSCTRIMDTLPVLLGGAAVNAGDSVIVTATSAVRILGLQGDEIAGTVTPFLPAF